MTSVAAPSSDRPLVLSAAGVRVGLKFLDKDVVAMQAAVSSKLSAEPAAGQRVALRW
jgi:hypothetical protein